MTKIISDSDIWDLITQRMDNHTLNHGSPPDDTQFPKIVGGIAAQVGRTTDDIMRVYVMYSFNLTG